MPFGALQVQYTDAFNGVLSYSTSSYKSLYVSLSLSFTDTRLLDSLKDPIFGALVGGNLDRHQPRAKLLSVGTTLVLVCGLEYLAHHQEQQQKLQQQQQYYTADADVLDPAGPWTRMSLTDHHHYDSRNADDDDDDPVSSRVFLHVCLPYCVFFGVMASLLQFNPRVALVDPSSLVEATVDDNDNTTTATTTTTTTYWHVVGYCLFAAIESFGSLAVATFWSFTNSMLSLPDAERFYGVIIALAQLGAILGSTLVTTHIWSSITLIVLACLVILLHVIVMRLYSRRFFPPAVMTTSSETLSSSRQQQQDQNMRRRLATNGNDETLDQHHHDGDDHDTTTTTLWSGVYLILRHNYVLLILGTSCLYEVSLTCLNYQMTLLGWSRFVEESPQTISFQQFMGHYGQMVNISSLLLSSVLFPWLLRRFGLRHTIRLFPTLLLLANMVAFGALPGNLTVLFFSMSLLKAMTYSIHDPAKEILYMPTANAIKFKSKFWIDVVGARIAKAVGSTINRMSGSVDRSIQVASAPSLLTAAALWWVCFRVGQQFDHLVQHHIVVGSSSSSSGGDHTSGLRHGPRGETDLLVVEHYGVDDDDDDDNNDEGPIGDGLEMSRI